MGRGGQRRNRKRPNGDEPSPTTLTERRDNPVVPSRDDPPTVRVSYWTDRSATDATGASIAHGVMTTTPKTADIPPPFQAEEFTHTTDTPSVLYQLWNGVSSTFPRPSTVSATDHWIATPTLIQLQAWSILQSSSSSTTERCSRPNVVSIAPTGSGKTLAYGLPLLLPAWWCDTKTNASVMGVVTGIVLVPTRELARQVQTSLHGAVAAAARCLPASSAVQCRRPCIVAWYGGVSKAHQWLELQHALAASSTVIVAATTGRLLDFVNDSQGTEASVAPGNEALARLTQHLQTIVLDEADRLATNKDLCEQTNTILQLLCRPCSSDAAAASNAPYRSIRKVLCSATWPDRATPAWTSWVRRSGAASGTDTAEEPCIVIQVDAMSVQATQRRPDQSNRETTNTPSGENDADADVELACEAHASLDDCEVTVSGSTGNKDLLLSRIPTNLTQVLHVCAEHKKAKKLIATLEAIRDTEPHQRHRPRGIIFFAKIKTVQYIATLLAREASHLGYVITALHSQMSQPARERALQDFTCGKATVLLATDIAARGIHANNVKFVVNYDFPSNLEQYVHRCGRAGRGGLVGDVASDTNRNYGTIYSFFTRNLAPLAPDLVALLEANHQWIDPNLRLLVEQPKRQSSAKKQKREATSAPHAPAGDSDDGWGADNDNADPFTSLSSTRIVLKRSSNVSDASDDDEDDETGPCD